MNLSPDQRTAGLLAPLFAIRSENDLGVGDIDSLRQLIDWSVEAGFRVVQLLPINETGGDNSPYMAISSVALEPTTLFLAPEALPDLSREDFETELANVDLENLRSGPVVYPAVKKLKLALLQHAFAHFSKNDLRNNTTRARKFRTFVTAEESWLEGFALFRVLMDEHGVNERWDLWPPEQQTAAAARAWLAALPGAPRKDFERRMRFYKYVQWLAFTQWREIKAYAEARGVALMGDVPFGISYYSADVFAHPEFFDLKWSGGAPPEPYFKDDLFTQKWGQNWGVPLYRWETMRGDQFAWWRRRVHMVREIFHLFRIDHVLGFYRIYCFPWRPQENPAYLPLTHHQARARTGGELPHFIERDDSSADHCAQNCRQGEEYLRALLEETGPHRLVGEDLGTVPDYVRPNLTSLGIAGFKIPMWEKKNDGWLTDGADYPRLSIITYATHDHEPLKARWDRLIRTAQENSHESAGAWDELVKFAAFAHLNLRWPQPWDDFLHELFLQTLFRSNSWMAICMITDLFATEQRFNVPGAVTESNWSQRLPYTVTQWRHDPVLKMKMERVTALLRETGRL